MQILDSEKWPPLPQPRPLLAIGHGTRDNQGRQTFLDFVAAYGELDTSRPVVSGFLELTTPTIQDAVDHCVQSGYRELSVLPILLFAARHNKFDVTNELDKARQRHPKVTFYYGRHFGITPGILQLWRDRLNQLDIPEHNQQGITRDKTVLLFVGRGSRDPDANGDVAKMARVLWEGSGYQTVETCFIGITHPRIEEGFRRASLYQPQRIIILPYFLFKGVLIHKVVTICNEMQQKYPNIDIKCLPEMGIQPQLLHILREREMETQLGQVQMNCEMCKFRMVADHSYGHHHHHHHDHNHAVKPQESTEQYHNRIWQVP